MKRTFAICLIAASCAAGVFYLGWCNDIAVNEVGLALDTTTGQIIKLEPGWHISAPWVLVAHVDAGPLKVCITSTSRSTSCRLVQFVPEAYQDFVTIQGFQHYWWANRFSINLGYSEEYRGFRDVMRGYAFADQHFTFMRILEETKTN